MENGNIHSSMSFQMKFIFKEVIYSLLYQVFHLHLVSVKHPAAMHLSSRCTSEDIYLETFISDKQDSNISKKRKNLLSLHIFQRALCLSFPE